MKTYILLLRGINVGGNNILPMKDLLSLLENNNYHNIKTYIQSGNVVLESEAKPQDIDLLIESKFGFRPNVLLLESRQLIKIADENPFKTDIGNHLHFYFCQQVPMPDRVKIEALKLASEEYCIMDKVVYFYAPDGIGRSKLAAKLEKLLGVSTTARNLNTVNKLLGLIADTE